MEIEELKLYLADENWPYTYTNSNRLIVRAIVYDDEGYYYFVEVSRDDEFGKATYIETSGGGVEANEDLQQALKRELKEELGAEVAIIGKIATISDYYNLIHRHNINNYYLCKLISFSENNLTSDEKNLWHLKTVKLNYEQAINRYNEAKKTKIGQLVFNREVPVLQKAHNLLSTTTTK